MSVALLAGLSSLLAGQSAPSGAAFSGAGTGASGTLADTAANAVPQDSLPLIEHTLPPAERGDAGAATESGSVVSLLWQQAIQEEIRQSEYHIRPKSAAPDGLPVYQSPNRAQNFRIHFVEGGITLQPRADAPYPWQWGLTLAAWGDARQLQPAAPASIQVEKNRLTYVRGPVAEWYVNDERGLEQGFTIQEPPVSPETGAEKDGRLFLKLIPHGNLTPRLTESGAAIDFFTGGGRRVIRYANLAAYDADGRQLTARMQLSGCGGTAEETCAIYLIVETDRAVYPITIDPLASAPDWSGESGQLDADFAYAVNSAGDVDGDGYADVLIGAPRYDGGYADEGAVFLYRGSVDGIQGAPQILLGGQAGAQFGQAAAEAGDVDGDGYSDVIVGAPLYTGVYSDEGRVSVYYGSAAGLITGTVWTVDGGQANSEFGRAVSGAGDVNNDGYADILIGAPGYDNGQNNEGRAYVYFGSGSGVNSSAPWLAESGKANARYGYAASGAGDVNGDGYDDVIIGAFEYTDDQTREGRVYVYQGNSGGLPAAADWTADGNQAQGRFGNAVSGAGDVNGDGYADVIIGAYQYDGGQVDAGRAYVYHGSAAGLSATASWTASGSAQGARLGWSVAAAGDVNGDGYADVAVGAPKHNSGGQYLGQALVFHGAAAGLSAAANWTAQSETNNDQMGSVLAGAGDVNGDGYDDLIVGAYLYNNAGRALNYLGSANGLSGVADWTAESDAAGGKLGISVAGAGDVNGDGYGDVIVGAEGFDSGGSNTGKVFVYHGAAGGLSLTADWTAEGEHGNAYFGGAAAGAGDVDGDSYADVIIGSPWYNNGQTREGKVYVYHGSANGLITAAAWMTESNQAQSYFGDAVGAAGDVNGDGYADVVVGAPRYGGSQLREGRVYLYYGSAGGLLTTTVWTAESGQKLAYLGASVGGAGDVNGDGYDDVIAGAPQYDNGEADEGRVYVYYGAASGPGGAPDWTAESGTAGSQLGYAASGAGDMNGDGYDDVIAGAPYFNNDDGRVFLYHGSAAGLAGVPDWSGGDGAAGSRFGFAAAAAGDMDGDNYADVIIGAPLYSNGESQEGAAAVYFGSAGGIISPATWLVESEQAEAQLGYAVAAAGDVNGDGYGDVIIGAPYYDHGQSNEGVVYVFYGAGSGSAPPAAGLTASPLSGSAPLTVTFANNSANAAAYQWQFGDGTVSAEMNPVHIYTQTGVYTVTLTATGPGGSDTETKTSYITVAEAVANEPLAAAFSASPVSGNAPLTVTFSNKSTGNITAYSWEFGDGSHSTDANPIHIYPASGVYTVSLTVTDDGGAQDTLVRPSYIFVNPAAVALPNQTPVVTITSPAGGDIIGSYNLQVSGEASDDGVIASVLVNGVPATLIGSSFSANVTLGGGSQTIHAVVEDNEGALGFDSLVARVDNEGPIIEIREPRNRQAVYSLNPTIAISYTDFLDTVNTASVTAQIADENGTVTDVTNDLTVTGGGAFGSLSAALTADTSYTLTVTAADGWGNSSSVTASFYVPADPGSVILPEEPEDAGWVSGVVYDSSSCNEHLTVCQGLPGARITFSYAGTVTDTITGTVVTGPDGFFAFPFAQTGIYWLRAEKDGYTYSQREVAAVKERSTAVNEIYLTPVDSAVTLCAETGCLHTSSSGDIQVDIPPGAIGAGETVTVTATSFDRVYFLPSGQLPPGTWETYAFNLGGDSDYAFQKPVTVTISNTLGFEPGTQIPLGYWNQSTLQWEHEGLATVDNTGAWVVMRVSHFSNHDPNFPLAPSGISLNTYLWTGAGYSCSAGVPGCFIAAQSGILQEWIDLPPLSVLGETEAPQLRYSTARANPSAVIDVQADAAVSGSVTANYLQWELYIEGEKTENFTIEADLSSGGEAGRYRLFWDGRNAQGEQLPPGIYNYAVRMRIPFTGEYCGSVGLIFGNPLDCENYPTGRFVNATEEKWTYGTVTLESTQNASLGDGWLLAGQQRLYADESGSVLVADANRQTAYYSQLADKLEGRGQYSAAQPQVLGPAAAVPVLPLPAAGTRVSGVITADTTWTAAQSPYIVTGTVTVTDGVTLTIEPGVQVMLDQYQSLVVEGGVSAVGTAARPITFTAYSSGPFISWEKYNGTFAMPVQSAAVEANGDIWFAGFFDDGSGNTAGVVQRLRADLTIWDTFYMPGTVAASQVYEMDIDSQGQKWIGTDGGLVMLDANGVWTHYQAGSSGLASNFVRAVTVDASDNVWFGTDSGVSKLAAGNWTTYTTADGLASNMVYAIAEDSDGNIWFGTDNGLSRLSPAGVFSQPYNTGSSGLLSNVIEDVAVDGDNSVWLTSPGYGVSVLLAAGGWTTYTTQNSGLASAFVRSIDVDRSGRKWIGYDMAGVSVLAADNSEWNYETAPRLSGDTVADVALAPNGDVWLAHEHDGATRSYGGAGATADGTIRSGYWDTIQIGGGSNPNDSDNSQLRYVTIEAGGAGGQASLFIYQSAPALADLRVWGSGGHGIAVSGGAGFSLADSAVFANRRDGVHIESGSGGHSLSNVTLQSNNGHGVYLGHPGAASITGATIAGNRGHAVFVVSSDNELYLGDSVIQGNGAAARLAVNTDLVNNQWLENGKQQIEWLNGTLNASRTWTKELEAYVILGPITVPDNVSLALDSGVKLLFTSQGTALYVDGMLLASGAPDSPVYFGPAAGLSGRWAGVRLGGGTPGDSDNSRLEYVVFAGAAIGLDVSNSVPALAYLTFLDNDVGLRANNAGGLAVSHSNFDGSVNYALENVTPGQPVTAVNNYWGAGGPHHPAQHPTNTGEEISDGVDAAPWRTTPVPVEGVGTFLVSRTATDHTTLVYDPDTGTYTRYYPDGGEIHFDAQGRHDYTLYPDGRTLTYTYNPDGATASMSITAPGESVPHWTWTFNYANGKLDSVTDPAGRITDFTVDENGQLVAVVYPDGSGETFFYDDRSLMTQHTDQSGDVSSYAYDAYGRIQTDARPIRPVYDPDTGQTGAVTELRHFTPSDTAYPLLNESVTGDPDFPAPAAPTSADLVDEIAFGRGGLSGHTNKWGSWTDVSDATGRAAQYERDEADNILRQTYPSGDCDRFTYDENGNPLTASRMSAADCALETPLNAQTVTMTYEPRFNQIKTITDPDGNTTTYFYDYEAEPNDGILTDDHLLARVEYPPVSDETGQVVTPTTQYTYNSWGLLETETDAAGKVTRHVYTQAGDTALFRPGVAPVPGLLTQVIEGDGAANPLITIYRDFDAQGNAGTVIRPGGADITAYAYDNMGRVISETNAAGTTTLYEYDAQGNLIRRVDDYTPDGVSGFNIVTAYEYDADDQLIHQEQTAAGLAAFTDYVADINGNPAQQQDELGYGATSLYDDADRLVNTIDALGQAITYTHDVNGRVATVTNPDGTVNRTEYDSFNRVARSISNWVDGVYDPNRPDEDIITSYQYDGRNNSIIVTDTLGRMSRTFYDDLNRVTGSIVNWTPGTTLADCATLPAVRDHDICNQTAYDEIGRTLIVTDTLGRMTRTFYDELGRVAASVTNWNPATLSTPDDCVLSPTNESEENICTLYGYDAAGRQITTTNALGQTSLTVYDAAGRPIVSVANWDGVTPITSAAGCHFPPLQPDVNVCSVTVYDALNRRVQTQDALGRVTDFAYDGLGRVVTTTRYLANGAPVVNVSHYDARGQNYAQTNAAGHTTNTVFDELGRAVTSISALGVASSQTYDEAGYVIATTNALGHVTASDYDGLGRLITATNPLGQATVYKYDGLGNQIGMVDAEGVETRYEYDGLNRQIAVIENWDGVSPLLPCPSAPQPDTNVCTQYQYDALGNQVSIVNALGYTATHTIYDSLNRAVVVEDALGNQTRTQYNALGYRAVVTDANGAVTRYFYDGLNRLTRIQYEADGETVEYAYDALGNRTVMTDSLGVTTYAYDDLSRLITVTSPLTGTLVYGYDLVGNRASLTYPDGKVVTYTYNADNQMLQVFDWDNGVTTYSYDAGGRLETTTLPNGVQTANSYDDANRLISLRHVDTNTGALQAEYMYQLDGLGNRQAATETLRLPDSGGGGLQTTFITYNYDPLYRLTGAVYTGGITATYSYIYDAAGNMTAYTDYTETAGVETSSVNRTFDEANRLLVSTDSVLGTTSFYYDGNGNLVQIMPPGVNPGDADERLYSYNQRNLLTSNIVSAGNSVYGSVADYIYDGNGNRVQEVDYTGSQPITITYTNDNLGLSQVLVASTGITTTHYLVGLDLISQDTGTETRALLADSLSSIRTEIVDEKVEVTATYAPYGNLLTQMGTRGTEFGFTGEQNDTATGLVYLRARYYSPELRLFISKDRGLYDTKQPGTMNGWIYVRNNPINLIDSSGLQPTIDCNRWPIYSFVVGEINLQELCRQANGPDNDPEVLEAREQIYRLIVWAGRLGSVKDPSFSHAARMLDHFLDGNGNPLHIVLDANSRFVNDPGITRATREFRPPSVPGDEPDQIIPLLHSFLNNHVKSTTLCSSNVINTIGPISLAGKDHYFNTGQYDHPVYNGEMLGMEPRPYDTGYFFAYGHVVIDGEFTARSVYSSLSDIYVVDYEAKYSIEDEYRWFPGKKGSIPFPGTDPNNPPEIPHDWAFSLTNAIPARAHNFEYTIDWTERGRLAVSSDFSGFIVLAR